jgi:hypothetical protein
MPMSAASAWRLCFLTSGLWAARFAQAQNQQPQSDPAATVQAFWQAVFAGQWPEAVGLLDLGDIERFRKAQLDAARRASDREPTVEDLLRRDPDMPRQAAEYEIKRRAKARLQYPPRPFWMFYGVDSAGQLERMPLEEAAARWVQGHDPLWQVAEFRRIHQCAADRSLDSLAASRGAIVYGSVSAGGDTAFVAFRALWFPMTIWPGFLGPLPPQIAVVQKGQDGWRIRALPSLLEGQSGMAGFDTRDCTSTKPPF